jgi:hypothetical protein
MIAMELERKPRLIRSLGFPSRLPALKGRGCGEG